MREFFKRPEVWIAGAQVALGAFVGTEGFKAVPPLAASVVLSVLAMLGLWRSMANERKDPPEGGQQ